MASGKLTHILVLVFIMGSIMGSTLLAFILLVSFSLWSFDTLLAFILLVSFSLWSFDLFLILLEDISIGFYLSLFASIAGFVLLSSVGGISMVSGVVVVQW